jgi:hydrogenase maturation factor
VHAGLAIAIIDAAAAETWRTELEGLDLRDE